jgi:hypothetical protein
MHLMNAKFLMAVDKDSYQASLTSRQNAGPISLQLHGCYQVSKRSLRGKSKLEIRASEEDVRRYLDGHLFRLPGFVARSLELQEEIKTDIVKAVDGMYVIYFER